MSHILLIEPDAILAATYKQAIEFAGHLLQSASTAQQAIQALDHTRSQLILLELQLPEHDGIEFLHELRSYPEWRDIPVVLLTNTPLKVLAPVQAALERDLGVVHCLYKPRTRLEQLLTTVGQYTKK